MEQKLVSFEVAKAIEYIGYPQECTDQVYTELGELVSSAYGEWHKCYDAPTYISVWLWLWNTKNIQIEVADKSYFAKAKVMGKFFVETNPEEAIASAIDYLVKNKLLK